MADELTADQVHAQVHALRAQAAQPPQKIELGRTQRAAIEQAQREAAGTDDIGPLLEFQGLADFRGQRGIRVAREYLEAIVIHPEYWL